MNQTATYWAPGPADRYGNKSFRPPVTVLVRWQDVAELFISPEGREETSSAVVYPREPLALQGYLVLGTSAAADPKTVAGAKEIRQRAASPNLVQTEVLNKVYL